MRTAQELVDLVPGMTLKQAQSVIDSQRKAEAPTATRFYQIIRSITKTYIGIWGIWEERHGVARAEVYYDNCELFEDAIKQAKLVSTSGRYYVDTRLKAAMQVYFVTVPMDEKPTE